MKDAVSGRFVQSIADIDLCGKRFGKLTVVKLEIRQKGGAAYFECRCDCGNIKRAKKTRLLRGKTVNCGECTKRKIVTGEEIWYFTIIGVADSDGSGGMVRCRCVCGSDKILPLAKVLSGGLKSCGCMQHIGTHQKSNHPLYKIWADMKKRCYNVNYKQFDDYGGRGITVCDEWLRNFPAFYDFCTSIGWESGLEIDRIDNDGPYSVKNCRFVKQAKNKRNARKTKWWVVDGVQYESSSLAAMSCGVSRRTVYQWCGTSPRKNGDIRRKEGCYAVLKYGEEK